MAMKNFSVGEVLTSDDLDVYCVNTLFARKTAAESVTSSTTMQDDDDLFVTVAANCVYHIDMMLRYDGANGDLTWQLVGPSGTTMHYILHRLTVTAVGQGDDGVFYGSGAENTGALGTGTDTATGITGIVITSSTAGTFKLQWAQNSSSVTATRLLPGSYFFLRRVS